MPKLYALPSLLVIIHFNLPNKPILFRSNDYLQQKLKIRKGMAFVIIVMKNGLEDTNAKK